MERGTKNLSIYSFDKYLLCTCHMSSTVVLGTMAMAVNKT